MCDLCVHAHADIIIGLLSFPGMQYNIYKCIYTGVRVPWQKEELKVLKEAFLNADRPPSYDEIRNVQKTCPALMNRTLAQIKSRAWALALKFRKS